LCTPDLETHQPPIQRVQEVGRSELASVDPSKSFPKTSWRAAVQCLLALIHIPDVPVSNLGRDTGYSESLCDFSSSTLTSRRHRKLGHGLFQILISMSVYSQLTKLLKVTLNELTAATDRPRSTLTVSAHMPLHSPRTHLDTSQRSRIKLSYSYNQAFIHSALFLTKVPQLHPKPVLHTVRSSASSFNFQNPLFP